MQLNLHFFLPDLWHCTAGKCPGVWKRGVTFVLRLCKPDGDTQAHRSQLWLLGDPAVIWFIWLSALLVLQEGLRLTHFLLRSFLLPCQLLEFKPSLCCFSAFRVQTMWCLPWLKGIIANAVQHDQIINVLCPEQFHSIPFTLRIWSWARSPIDCGRLFKRFLSRFRT